MGTVSVEVFYGRPLGEGGQSTVYRGAYNSEPAAFKQLDFRKDGNYFEEATVLSSLRHDNIIKVVDLITYKSIYYVVLELAQGGTLSGAIRRKDLDTAQKLSTILQISNGLAYLHERPLLHLDLKPSNILFKDCTRQLILIADFGMAKFAAESFLAGAHHFRARDYPFTEKSDVYSLASIACCILAEKTPATPGETREIASDVLQNYNFGIDLDLHRVIERGVDPDPSIRPLASEFRDAFENRQTRRSHVIRQLQPSRPAIQSMARPSEPRVNDVSEDSRPGRRDVATVRGPEPAAAVCRQRNGRSQLASRNDRQRVNNLGNEPLLLLPQPHPNSDQCFLICFVFFFLITVVIALASLVDKHRGRW